MNKDFFSKERFKYIIILALFNYIFLGTEYLFDNIVGDIKPQSVVTAQSYILGASVLGFLFFAIIKKYINKKLKYGLLSAFVVVETLLFALMEYSESYGFVVITGCVMFALFGVMGSAVYYIASVYLKINRNVASTIGLAYGLGIMFQFGDNNIVASKIARLIIFAIVLVVWIAIILNLYLEENAESQNEKSRKVKYEKTESKNIECKNTALKNAEYKNSRITAIVLIITIMLMACIFSTLDNIVTYYHSKGIMDIGQYPRLLLAISGVVAGVLFDLKERKLMCLIMYSVTLLSTICMLVITMGEPFIIGLVVFYLSAGFFSVFFTIAFVNLSFEMKTPELWAGMGRAANNLCAVLMGTVFFSLFNSTNMLSNSIVIIILFVFVSIFMAIYYGKNSKKSYVAESLESDDKKMEHFVQQFSLSKRECEVLETLLKSDKNVKEIAQELYISRAALYRHISNMNEKTDTKSREGLIKFYYQWKKSGKN
ncbi:LuxR family transcriptional regulator [Eubacterium ventriosum]|uniref:LuxR family transcriptional regulator n=1 Tax=Eubacterium ventriosum TaxID=39496 RepID=UPI002E763096|nr:LuxR family transcriptional regulator [Eubacterium ventriosum]MEE0854756.1 LuxR family transcriptional regulator [Eubacterium ventriosum]